MQSYMHNAQAGLVYEEEGSDACENLLAEPGKVVHKECDLTGGQD